MPLRRLPLTIMVSASLLLGLSACTSPARRALEASPDYKAGYGDGCATASSGGGANTRQDSMTRDEQAYRTNPGYRAGWGTGFTACKPYQPPPSQPGGPGMGF